jgi:hypothetical protein
MKNPLESVRRLLLMFAWLMSRQVNFFALFSGRPLDGLGSFAVQRSIKPSYGSIVEPFQKTKKYLIPPILSIFNANFPHFFHQTMTGSAH